MSTEYLLNAVFGEISLVVEVAANLTHKHSCEISYFPQNRRVSISINEQFHGIFV